MSKTVTALALSVVHKRLGNFSLDDSAARFYPQWRGTSREAITIRHLLKMESGLDWSEEYGAKSTTSEMFYNSKYMAAYVAALPLAHAPGTRFNYASGDTLLLSGIFKKLVGGTLQASNDFYQRNLFAPIGVSTAVIQPDISGTAVGAGYNYMSAEDWLRMGQRVLNRGQWQGQQVLDASWIDETARPTAASAGDYGGQVWRYYAEPMAQYELPRDIILFHGVQHQLMAVIRSRNLVFLRPGVYTGDDSDANFNNSIRARFTALQRVLAAKR
jgi:CubicO group peptidase (beta-lactamase class C family)